MKKMNLSRVSSEEIITMFENAFEEQVADLNNIGAFDVDCAERKIGQAVQMNVDISGMAGTPTIDQFRKGEIEGSDSITISRDDIGEMKFHLLPKMTAFLSGNDYLIVYESE